jgi:hypothetical protein
MLKTSGFRTIICIDVENFSSTRRKHSDQVSIRDNLYRIAREALRELSEPLEKYRFDDRGDGMLIVAPPGFDNEWLARKFLRTLDRRVRRHNESKPRPECRFRLRVAINIGDVEFDENGVVGDAVITAFRMLDSRRLKNELANSTKIALAACISPRFYEQAVARIPIEAEFRRRSFKTKNASGFIWVWTGNGCGRLRPTRRGIGALTLVLLAAGISLVLPHRTPAAPPSLLGPNPQMADPCALVAPGLSRFGTVELDTRRQEFSRCDVIVRSGESKVDIKVQFHNSHQDYARYAVPIGRIGRVAFMNSCERILILPDANSVEIDATQESGTADLCAMSDAAAEHAINVLNNGPVPQRGYQEIGSLFHDNACRSLSIEQLTRILGTDADEPNPDFGNWACSWKSSIYNISLKIIFHQSPGLDASNSRPTEVRGRSAFVKPDKSGGACLVQIPSPWFRSLASPANTEVLWIVVEGFAQSSLENPPPIDKLCEMGVRVAS